MLRFAFAALLVLAGCDSSLVGVESGPKIGSTMIVYDETDGRVSAWTDLQADKHGLVGLTVGTHVAWLGSGHKVGSDPTTLDRVRVLDGPERDAVAYLPPKNLKPAPK